MVKLKIVSLLFCLCIIHLSVQAAQFKGQVVGVTDGDTIKVIHDGTVTKVRLSNVDAPEHNQSFGQRAKQFTSDYVFGKVVEIDDRGHDRYGRTLGEVAVAGNPMDLNHALVANGMAWAYKQYCHDASFYLLETIARTRHLGLWADSDPQPPWEFRQHEKQQRAERKSLHVLSLLSK